MQSKTAPGLIGPGPWGSTFLPHLRQFAFEERIELLVGHAAAAEVLVGMGARI